MGAPAPPGQRKNFFRRNLQGKCVSAPPGHEVHPQPEQESIFRTLFAGRVRFGYIFRRSLRATTKKRSSTFLAKKVHPQTKSWIRLWICPPFLVHRVTRVLRLVPPIYLREPQCRHPINYNSHIRSRCSRLLHFRCIIPASRIIMAVRQPDPDVSLDTSP